MAMMIATVRLHAYPINKSRHTLHRQTISSKYLADSNLFTTGAALTDVHFLKLSTAVLSQGDRLSHSNIVAAPVAGRSGGVGHPKQSNWCN